MKIKLEGAQILSDKLNDVAEGEDIQVLIKDMFNFMYTSKGIGLAANQIGYEGRVFVMDANGFKQAFVNPIITKRYGGKTKSLEGCLSFPDKKVNVTRDRQIIIEGFNQYWKPIRFKLKGVAAICAQHELDHLNGTTIV